MPAQSVTMARKRKSDGRNTDAVKIDADLVRKIRVISLAEDRAASDILSEWLRAKVETEYPKALKKLVDEQ
jgi:hypothetical protein